MALGLWNTLATLPAPGTALTAAARASATQGTNATQARYTLPGNALKTLGDQILVTATGIVSCVVTTPGTFRLDFAMDTTAKMDTGAIPLNIVARTSTPWYAQMLGTLTAAGTAAVLTWSGFLLSDAIINTALQATGPGPGGTILPYSGTATGASTASASFDATVSHLLDLYFTQTVATGSFTLNQLNVAILTATGF